MGIQHSLFWMVSYLALLRQNNVHVEIPLYKNPSTLPAQYPCLNLATVSMCQPTVESSKTVCSGVEMWQVYPEGKRTSGQRATEEIWNNREARKHDKTKRNRQWKANNQKMIRHTVHLNRVWRTCRAENEHSDIQFLQSFCFFCSPPLDLFHSLLLFQTGVSFFSFPAVSTLQRQVLLSHYLIMGAMEEHLFSLWHSGRPVTFMEGQLCWFTGAFQLNK